jgi:hypothetical protein
VLQGQQGSSQSSGKSSQSKLTLPPHEDGSGLQLSPPHCGLLAQTLSAQQTALLQSFAVHGQHCTVPGIPPEVMPTKPAGQDAVSPSPSGQTQPMREPSTLHCDMHAGLVAHENASGQPGRKLQL